MKKIISVILALVVFFSCCAGAGEDAETESMYGHLTVGVTTAFSGNFLADAMGSNISDQDVRKLLHSYHLVTWDSENGVYNTNDQVVTALVGSSRSNTYIFTIAQDLTYSDGTPITARDYAFSFLLLTSGALKEASGLRENGSRVLGWTDYDQGTAATVTGFRITGDYQISITIAPEYTPYFYEMKTLDIFPLPIHVIAPGCEVRDDGDGIYLSGDLSAELLEKTLLDAESGYASHPSVVSGPYRMTGAGFDGNTVWLTLNPEYKGDEEGSKPVITNLTVRYVHSRDLLSALAAGDIDLAVRCARTEMIRTGQALAATEDFALRSYSRNGLGFISFCGEKGPTADPDVRRAVAMCLDKEGLVSEYLGSMGTPVKGYYGIGQWMFPMTRGMIPDAWIEAAGEGASWDDMTLDGVTEYTLDPEAARTLLDMAGWNLNADGEPWSEGIRHRREGDTLVPLQLTLIYPDDNLAGPLLDEYFTPYLTEAGIGIEYVSCSMPVLLKKYYALNERDCDMIMLGSNFQDVFDPSVNYDEFGKDVLNGITDPELADLALEMRGTDPGDPAEYVRRWIRYLERRSEVLPEITLYSNAYMDFFTSSLQNYNPGSYSAWSEALLYAYLSDAAEENESGEELFD